MEIDVARHQRVVAYGVDGISHRVLGVVKSLKPVVEVYAAERDGVYHVLVYAALQHQPLHLGTVHVAGAAVGVGHHHDFLYPQFVDGHQQTAHGRVEGADDQSAGVLDDFCVTVFQSQCCREQFGESCIHTREYCQLLVGVFAGNILFVTASGYKLFIIFYDFFDNHGCLLLGLWGAGAVL